ncbi:family 20 glycosylhydrolase [Usitatibacter palustris]|uniref:beta-N-acetylhexosaminidase n=1 Tax=Usitatibacter palustris TaxID=2732487 RepID=A0A6M4HAQ2_9PROT|nr:family 20 glycosylhydrolase [Usitatibacter palustris]QJR16740.1 hypothetical protein DSM104440_03576 [Usitatibacter palustris]
MTKILLLLALAGSALAAEPTVIPNPASIARAPGSFALARASAIVVPANDAQAERIATRLRDLLGVKAAVVVGAPRDGAINLVREGAAGEGYRLDVTAKRVTIASSGTAGLFHGGTTLWQLASARDARGSISAMTITDAPRFSWRGVMLDSARHYQSPEFIKRFVDWMAMHKLNVLHWHLTDDQAWRIEIKKYPKLTSVAAWRVPAGFANAPQYGGFYSQDTVREIVAYAAERQITVVPEIEMPGHATAPIAAYPELASTATPPTAASPDWGVFANAYSPDDATFTFLEDVLTEVMALFPSKYIHVGGDEVEKEQWKHWPAAQARMKELGISEPAGLQTYFTQRIGKFLAAKGRRLVGWDEILTPGMPQDAVVMSWRGIEGALEAASKGHDAILSPWPTLYFDNRQGAGADEPPGRGNTQTLETVYRFEPMPPTIKPEQRHHVLGLQGNLWSEHIRTEPRMAHMAFPRAAAIAELGWSQPERRDWKDFLRRLPDQFARYENVGLPYADSAFAVRATVTQFAAVPRRTARAQVELATQVGQGEIRYTIDGKDPTVKSPLYRAPLSVVPKGELRAAAFSGATRLSRPRVFALAPEFAMRRKSQDLKLCTENISLSLEDDAPLNGERAAFLVDVQNPCWIYPAVDLDTVASIEAAVGQIPFNFQIGEAVKKITFPKPTTPEGELEVRIDSCTGDVIARLPVLPASASQGVTTLPTARISASGRHDLCLRFAQPALEPVWVIDSIRLVPRAPAAVLQAR